jgi:hypothetical protein
MSVGDTVDFYYIITDFLPSLSLLKIPKHAGRWWLMCAILATQEAQIRRIEI